MPVQTLNLNFSEDFKALCNRRLELGEYVVNDAQDARQLSALYEALAQDYADAGYDGTNAYNLRKKAEHYARLAQNWSKASAA